MAEAWGYEPRRRINCACGFGKILPTLKAALAVMEWHREIGCEGCDHVMSLETVEPRTKEAAP